MLEDCVARLEKKLSDVSQIVRRFHITDQSGLLKPLAASFGGNFAAVLKDELGERRKVRLPAVAPVANVRANTTKPPPPEGE